jgi:hypothetical protein
MPLHPMITWFRYMYNTLTSRKCRRPVNIADDFGHASVDVMRFG